MSGAGMIRAEIEEKIQLAHDAGIDITAAINALDALDDDADFEPEEDGESISESVQMICTCTCGDRHNIGTWPDIERMEIF